LLPHHLAGPASGHVAALIRKAMNRHWAWLTLAVLVLVALVYSPVWQAGLVWDDKTIFRDNAWLRYGDAWQGFIFRNFADWGDYFRPLAVALFTFEARVLDALPASMHLVSLCLHLGNTMLVGMLARRLLPADTGGTRAHVLAALAMLGYGLHPALVEPVVWISCQAELLLTLFVLLGLLCNVTVRAALPRAAAVGACFFLAACCKESAIALPALVLLLDWLRDDAGPMPALARVRAIWQRQCFVYFCVFGAGIAYLALRWWAMGTVLHRASYEPFLSFGRLQTVCYLYLAYWRILAWPMRGLGPLHEEVEMQQLNAFDPASLAFDLLAFGIGVLGLRLAWKRNFAGGAIVGVTLALLPVLHIVPVTFERSLYHERYAMIAAAMLCSLLPAAFARAPLLGPLRRAAVTPLLGFAFWLGFALLNVRAILPLWSDETKLWTWALRDNPHSISAQDHLLSTWLEAGDYLRARPLAVKLVAESAPCPNCMINAANLGVAQGDAALARSALDKASHMPELTMQPRMLRNFILASAQLREFDKDTDGADKAYRDAIAMDPLEPEAHMRLALLLARGSRVPEAREAMTQALALYMPQQREARRKEFEAALAARPAATAPQPPL